MYLIPPFCFSLMHDGGSFHVLLNSVLSKDESSEKVKKILNCNEKDSRHVIKNTKKFVWSDYAGACTSAIQTFASCLTTEIVKCPLALLAMYC